MGTGRVNGTANVTALLGDGKGGFSAPVISAITGIKVAGIPPQAAGDFNSDGVLDFAVIGTDPTTGAPALGMMLGKGNGSFDAPREIILPGRPATGELAAEDFTGDGALDLVFANDSNILVLPGKGNGKFGAPIISPISQFRRCLVVGDFNHDAKLDLTVGTSVELGNGDGTFQSPIAVNGGGCNVAVADLNGDGNPDLITGPSGLVHVYLGDGTGQFNHFKAYKTGRKSIAFSSFAVADFNGDGHPDIAVLNSPEQDVTILLNQANGRFKIGDSFNGGAYDLVGGTFNGDTKQDLVISSGQINVLTGKGNGTFNDTLAQNTIVHPSQAMAADFNNDGKVDLLTFRLDAGVQLGNGNGTFQPRVLLPESCRLNNVHFNGVVSAAIGDFNQDHKPDLALIVANGLGVGVCVDVCLGNGNGTFQDAVLYDGNINHQSVVAGDFDNDGKLDLAVSDQGGISILLGKGNGTFRNAIPISFNASFPIFTVGDFDNDGKLDVAAITDATISVLLGKGNGKFGAPLTSNNSPAGFVVAGDLNKDGNLDLLTVNSNSSNTISVLLGKGDGTFKASVNYPDDRATQLALGDFNGDGKLDVAFSEQSHTVDVLFGNGDGTLGSPNKFRTFSGPGWAAPGDFNGDGALDLADLTGERATKLLVFLNTR